MMVTATNPHVERLNGEQVTILLQRAAEGDSTGWQSLVREFGGLIRAIARGHGLGEADTADVAQATWLKLIEHLDRITEPARVGAWLATTARRECLRLLRESKRQVLLGLDEPELESTEAPLWHDLLVAERDLALHSSFSRLRTRDQTLLRLLLADARPDYEQISSTLGMPIGSIGPTRARALERLRTELERDEALQLVAA